ncbi:MAG TPA: hypothetical protein VKU82_12520 [Planctomycetaceae bacterium]|nr:hypothetical protein [Planctomycetaceae bacterium]
MKTASIFVLTLAAAWTARADFSYTTSPKSSGGLAAAAAAMPTSKYYFKGQKMKVENGDVTTVILDFDAQTVTGIDNRKKTYSVTPFSEIGQELPNVKTSVQAEVKETGQKKTINGFTASELLMTMAMDNPQAKQAGMNMQMEIEMWLSPDVPGASELRSFYQKNAPKFPWAAVTGGGNPGMQNAIVEMQKRMAGSGGGVPVLQVIRAKSAGNDAQSAQLQAGMAQARARLEEMAKQSGPAGDAARQALARMGGGAAGGGALFEMTVESSNFSTSSIPDSVFSIPAGYQKTDKK